MTLCLTTHSEDETTALGSRLGAVLHGGAVILLDGDLGAGKTRFAKGVARALGVSGTLTSPTFNLVLEYPLANDDTTRLEHPRYLRHFDLYRLEQAEQLDDLDYFGLIEEQDAVSLVEWGSKFASHLPLDYVLVNILMVDGAPEQRTLELSAEGARSEEMLERFALAEEVQ